MTTAVSVEDLNAWGWRIPFLLALPLGAIGLYIRSRLEETPVFNEIAEVGEKSSSPLRQILGSRSGWQSIGRAILFSLPCQVPGYLLMTFMPTFLAKNAMLSSNQALTAIAIAVCAVLAVQPLAGRLSDRIGRRRTLFIVALAQFVTAYPAFMLIHQGGFAIPTLGLILIGVPYGLGIGTQLAPIMESFPTAVRYTGFAVALSLVVALGAGPTPFVSTWLVSVTGSSYAPTWLIMGFALPSLLAAFFLRETHNRPLPN
jgi:MHS family proline/betaine transporter-like MFS transporter